MHPRAYRKAVNLSQEQFAAALGIASKAYISRLERGVQAWPVKLALKAEEQSNCQLSALSLVDPEDADLLRRFADRRGATEIGGHA